jgi:hypothetical protein
MQIQIQIYRFTYTNIEFIDLTNIHEKVPQNLGRHSPYEHNHMIQGMNVSQTYGDSSSESASAHNPMNRPNLDAPAPAKERRPQNKKI